MRRPMIWLSMALSIVLLLLLPFFYASLMTASLAKLHISQQAAVLLVIAIIVGGFINIPIAKVAHPEALAASPLAVLGLDQFFPGLQRQRRPTVIAVNVGGCLIPLGIAFYQLANLAERGPALVGKAAIAALLATLVCYFLARPVPGLGIAMPGLVPPTSACQAERPLTPNPRRLCFAGSEPKGSPALPFLPGAASGEQREEREARGRGQCLRHATRHYQRARRGRTRNADG